MGGDKLQSAQQAQAQRTTQNNYEHEGKPIEPKNGSNLPSKTPQFGGALRSKKQPNNKVKPTTAPSKQSRSSTQPHGFVKQESIYKPKFAMPKRYEAAVNGDIVDKDMQINLSIPSASSP